MLYQLRSISGLLSCRRILEAWKRVDATKYDRHSSRYRFFPYGCYDSRSLQILLCSYVLLLWLLVVVQSHLWGCQPYYTGWFDEALLEDIYTCLIFLPSDWETLGCCNRSSSQSWLQEETLSCVWKLLSWWINNSKTDQKALSSLKFSEDDEASRRRQRIWMFRPVFSGCVEPLHIQSGLSLV